MKINNWNQLLNYNNLIIFLNEHNIFVLLITCFFFNFFYFLIKLVSNIFNFIGKINKLIKFLSFILLILVAVLLLNILSYIFINTDLNLNNTQIISEFIKPLAYNIDTSNLFIASPNENILNLFLYGNQVEVIFSSIFLLILIILYLMFWLCLILLSVLVVNTNYKFKFLNKLFSESTALKLKNRLESITLSLKKDYIFNIVYILVFIFIFNLVILFMLYWVINDLEFYCTTYLNLIKN